VAGARELLPRRRARRARADDRNVFESFCRRAAASPSRIPGLVDDRVLDRLDRNGVGVNARTTLSRKARGTNGR